MNRRLRFLLIAVVSTAACDDFKCGPFDLPSPHFNGPFGEEIGPDGGALLAGTEGDGGQTASVSIPPGALAEGVEVTAEESPDSPTPANALAVGIPVVFGPEGTAFSEPVTVTLEFDPALIPDGGSESRVEVFTAPVGSTTFVSLGGTVVGFNHVSAQTNHFSVFVPAIPLVAGDGGPSVPGDGG